MRSASTRRLSGSGQRQDKCQDGKSGRSKIPRKGGEFAMNGWANCETHTLVPPPKPGQINPRLETTTIRWQKLRPPSSTCRRSSYPGYFAADGYLYTIVTCASNPARSDRHQRMNSLILRTVASIDRGSAGIVQFVVHESATETTVTVTSSFATVGEDNCRKVCERVTQSCEPR